MTLSVGVEDEQCLVTALTLHSWKRPPLPRPIPPFLCFYPKPHPCKPTDWRGFLKSEVTTDAETLHGGGKMVGLSWENSVGSRIVQC